MRVSTFSIEFGLCGFGISPRGMIPQIRLGIARLWCIPGSVYGRLHEQENQLITDSIALANALQELRKADAMRVRKFEIVRSGRSPC